jgi:Cohesin domain/PEP-CTERM motif
MLKTMHTFTALAGAALALLSSSAVLAAPTLSITGPSSSVWGQSFSLSVMASDMADLYAYQFDLTFDPSKFRSTGVTEGSFLAGAGSTFFSGGTTDNANGSVSFVFDTLLGPGPGANGSGVLATFNFTTIGAGAGTFALANTSVLNASLGDIQTGTQSLNVVAAVPEPATWAFMFAGLGVVGACARRRMRGQAEEV